MLLRIFRSQLTDPAGFAFRVGAVLVVLIVSFFGVREILEAQQPTDLEGPAVLNEQTKSPPPTNTVDPATPNSKTAKPPPTDMASPVVLNTGTPSQPPPPTKYAVTLPVISFQSADRLTFSVDVTADGKPVSEGQTVLFTIRKLKPDDWAAVRGNYLGDDPDERSADEQELIEALPTKSIVDGEVNVTTSSKGKAKWTLTERQVVHVGKNMIWVKARLVDDDETVIAESPANSMVLVWS